MNHNKRRLPRPSHGQPGTLREQLRAIAVYLLLPAYYRHIDPTDAWQFARERIMAHAAGAAG